MDQRKDSELVALARNGDKAALGDLFERCLSSTIQIALNLVKNEDLAKDLVQEAMLQAYLSLRHLRNNSRFRSWLNGIVINVCRDHFRMQRIDFLSYESIAGGTVYEGDWLQDCQPSPLERVEQHDLHRQVLHAVQALSPKVRETTLLFYYDNLDLREISALLGISVGAAKGRLFRARKLLKTQFMQISELEILVEPEGRERMHGVEIVDIIKSHGGYVIVLLNDERQRWLPISVDEHVGQAIARGIKGYAMPRPLTHDFIVNILNSAEVSVEEARIESFKETTFYAVIKIRNGDLTAEIDSRPSDAMALALLTESPIYVSDEIMETLTRELSDELRDHLGDGVESIIRELDEVKRMAEHEERWIPRKKKKDKAV